MARTLGDSRSSLMKMWFSDYMLELFKEGWRKASVPERCKLSAVACSCKAMYLRIARQILEETSHQTARALAEELHCLEAMDWDVDHGKAFLLNETFCRREDGAEFVLSRCHRSQGQVLELLSVSSSNRVGISTGGRGMLCKRASTWNDLACDAWTIVAVSFCSKLLAGDMKSLVALNLLHLSLKLPEPSRLRSWPCKRALAHLRELWRKMPPKHRREIAELRAEMFWYVQACDISVAALSLIHLQRKSIFIPVTQDVLHALRSSSKLLSHLEHEIGRACMSRDFCERADSLDILHQRAVWHSSQKNAILDAVYHCNWKEACTGDKPFPLVASKGTLYSDVERVVATLLLDRLLFYGGLIFCAQEDTDSFKAERDLKKQQASEKKHAKKKLKKATLNQKPQEATLSHAERYLAHRLLATAPRWDISCLKVKWTFFELEENGQQSEAQVSAYIDS